MTKEQTIEKDNPKFEDLMVKKNAQDAVESQKWTEVRVTDVQAYQGIEFADIRAVKDDEVDTIVRGTVSESSDPQSVFHNIENGSGNSYELKTGNFGDVDGSFVSGNRKYLYRERRFLVITVESPDGGYEDEFIITKELAIGNKSIEDIYRDFQNGKDTTATIGSPPYANNKYIRLGSDSEDSVSSMWMKSMFKIGSMSAILTSGLIFSLFVLFATGSLIVSSVAMMSCVFAISHLHQRMYSGWYEISPIGWTDDLPESANITSEITDSMNKDGFETVRSERLKGAEPTVSSDGSLTIEDEVAKWTFEGSKNGVPSDEAIDIYNDYGGIEFSERETIPIYIRENKDEIPVGENEYISDDGLWVMRPDGL